MANVYRAKMLSKNLFGFGSVCFQINVRLEFSYANQIGNKWAENNVKGSYYGSFL